MGRGEARKLAEESHEKHQEKTKDTRHMSKKTLLNMEAPTALLSY